MLGPLLFILYTNDLNFLLNKINDIPAILFADDTALVNKGINAEMVAFKLNNILHKILDWANYNKLSLNASKTKIMCGILQKKIISLKISKHKKIKIKRFLFFFYGLSSLIM